MSPSPRTKQDTRAAQDYGAAWRAIMQLVRSGSSWSGRERNVAFLNCPQNDTGSSTPRFANVSAVAGLDLIDDGRGLAVGDWDCDGDLDLWFRNRTGPRLRLLINRSQQIDPQRRFISLRLKGTRSNRDAIGARVELLCSDGQQAPRRVQTVRAGDAFLSQSSKWVHFGLGNNAASVEGVVVQWPGGARERFTGVSAPGRYELTEGTGVSVSLAQRAKILLSPQSPRPVEPTAAARVVMPADIAMPTMELYDAGAGGTRYERFTDASQANLLVFWTHTCPNCCRELRELVQYEQALREAGVDVVAICLDANSEPSSAATAAATKENLKTSTESGTVPLSPGLGKIATVPDGSETGSSLPEAAQAFLQNIGFRFHSTTIETSSLDRVRHFQNALFDKYPEFVVPLSFLLDAQGNVLSVYRGTVAPEVVIRDRQLAGLSDTTRRDLAVPLSGSWFTKPATKSQFAEYVGQRLFAHDNDEGLRYLELAMNTAEEAGRRDTLRGKVVNAHLALARHAAAQSKRETATAHFEAALRCAPDSGRVHQDYATFCAQQGDWAKAERHVRTAARLQPDDPVISNMLQEVLNRSRQQP